MRALMLGFLCFWGAWGLKAAEAADKMASIPEGSYVFQPLTLGGEAMAPAFVLEALRLGAHALIPLSESVTLFRQPGGALSRLALADLLERGGPVYFLAQEGELLKQARLKVPGPALETLPEALKPSLVARIDSLPRLGLLENSSSIAPLSKPLGLWGAAIEKIDFAEAERGPQAVFDLNRFDLVCFSSPGWWDDFANSPSGPSRMKDPVTDAVRAYVQKGGSALFTDLAQWDMQRIFPGSLVLNALGPYKSIKIKGPKSLGEVKVALAPFGVAPQKVLGPPEPVVVFHQPKYSPGAGKTRKLIASYGISGPRGAPGLVYGQAYHPFDQDEEDGLPARRLFLNMLLAVGANRGSLWQGGDLSPVPTLALPAPATQTPDFSPFPSPSDTRTQTAVAPSPTPSMSVTRQLPTASHTGTATFRNTPSLTATQTVLKPNTHTRTVTQTLSFTRTHTPKIFPSSTSTRTLTPWVRRPTLTSTHTRVIRPTRTFTATRTPTVIRALRKTPVPSPVRREVLPTFTLTKTPTKIYQAAAPQPTVALQPQAQAANLGAINSAPEPFNQAGVYLYYALHQPAKVTLTVYDQEGKTLRVLGPFDEQPGQAQHFYDGKMNNGKRLWSGAFYWGVDARFEDGHKEQRLATFTRR
jgi:hypothetical protein